MTERKIAPILLILTMVSIFLATGIGIGCSGSLPSVIDIFGPTEVQVGKVVQYTADVTGGKFVVPKNGDPNLDTSSTSTIVVTSLAGAYQVQRGMLYYLIPYYTTDFEEAAGRCEMTPGGQFTALAADWYAVSYRLNGRLIGLLGVEAYLAENGEDVIDITDPDGNDLGGKDIVITIIGGGHMIYIDGYAPFTFIVSEGPVIVVDEDPSDTIIYLVVKQGYPDGEYPVVIKITDDHGNVYFWRFKLIVVNSSGDDDDDDDTDVQAVVVLPTSVEVEVGATKQFTASVYPTSANQSVVWSTTYGSVSSTGLYTAPGAVGSGTVTATSTGDATKKSSVTVNVVENPDDGGISVVIEAYLRECIAAQASTRAERNDEEIVRFAVERFGREYEDQIRATLARM